LKFIQISIRTSSVCDEEDDPDVDDREGNA